MLRHLIALCVLGYSLQASVIYTVSLDTTPLIGHVSGPFQLDFQLTDGDGAANNTIVLTSFSFGGGSAGGSGVAQGGASGSLGAGITLTDSNFFNAYTEGFTPGSTLQFQIESTTFFAGGTPDQFSFGILDNLGNFLATSFFDVFVTFDIDGVSPTLSTGTSPITGGPKVTAGPIVPPPPPPPASVPEPATMALTGAGLLFVALRRR